MAPATILFDSVFAHLREGDDPAFIEVRAIHPEYRNVVQSYHRYRKTAITWAETRASAGFDVFFGVALRKMKEGTARAFHSTGALWVDVDSPELPGNIYPPPSFIIGSGRGFHIYWFLEEPITSPVLAADILKRLALRIGGDTASAEIARILRIPGTLNHKYSPPTRVATQAAYPHRRYTAEDFADLPPQTLSDIINPPPEGARSEHDWAVINQLFKQGYSRTFVEGIYQTFPVGDKALEADSPNYLEHTINRALANLFAIPTQATYPARTDTLRVTSDTLALPPSTTPPVEKRVGDTFFAGDDAYYKVSSSGNIERLSSFLFKVQAIQESEVGDIFIVDMHVQGKTWRNFALPAKVFNTSLELAQFLPYAGLVWYGSDMQTRKLREYLVREWAELGYPQLHVLTRIGTTLLDGETAVFTASDHVHNADLSVTLDAIPVLRHTEHPDILLTEPVDPTPFLQRVLDVNRPEVILPLLGWFTAAHLKPILAQSLIRFPHLMVYGSRGAGKTTLITRVFQPYHNYRESSVWQANSTPFVLLSLLGSSNSTPVCLTEFREGTQKYQGRFLQLLRTAYDFGRDARGRADQTTTEYLLTAPICLDGEDSISDSAMQERILSVYMDVRNVYEHSAALQRLLQLDIAGAGAHVLRTCLGLTQEQILGYYNHSLHLITEVFDNTIPERVRNNQAIALMGLDILQNHYKTPWRLNASFVRQLFSGTIEDLIEPSFGRTRQSVDDFIEDVCNHILSVQTEGARSEEVAFRYQPAKDGAILGFHLKSAYNWWSRHTQEPISLQAIKKQLREQMGEKGYLLDAYNAQTQFGRVMRLYFVDLVKASEKGLDIDIVD